MINNRIVEIAVGALMIAGIISLLMLALQVSGLGSVCKTEEGYRVYAYFENVGALKPRAKVSVAGVVVGRVVAIELEPKSFNAKVTISLATDRSDKFPIDTQASIVTAGLLGDNYITLAPGFDDAEFLQEGSHIPIENTHSALILEKLISRFLANQVSGDKDKTQNKEKIEETAKVSVSNVPIESKEETEKTLLQGNENKTNTKNGLPTPSLEKQIEH